jgi:succinate-acetate transporter protein
MTNLNNKNKNKNILGEKLIVFFLFTVVLVFKSLKTLSRIFTYGILKKEILTTKSNLGVDIKIKIK